MDNVFKLHCCPTSVTSDRDPIFVRQFWKDFMADQGIQVQLSTAYHPHTDGQTKVMNRCIETYLRLSQLGECITRSNAKLAPKYYGPYAIIDKIGSIAYKIQLPVGSLIHDVFHLSQLKKFVGEANTSTHCPRNDEETRIKEPEAIIERMTVKRRNKVVTKVLVKWKHLLPEDATWEFFFDLKKKFPNFNPRGKGLA
ncbi:uncharacterized protein LOC114396874 [Glycine soja]|uniref:uncharacterized protein LOC114396874 n=1 Tax=Glycine soja TaxID=3848 RepID=UPI00103D5CE7|nr:uncharacterized protein LOC114396874 [Glycine soja]